MTLKSGSFAPRRAQAGRGGGRAAAGAHPHRRRRRQAADRLLGPLGSRRQRRDAQAVQALADKNKVDVQADFITSNGYKNLLTIAAEAQAKTGHDVQPLPGWETQNHADCWSRWTT